MGILSKILGSGAGDLIEKVGGTIDKFVTTGAEKEQMKQEMLKLVNDHQEKVASLAQAELDSQLKDSADARNREIAIATSDKAPKINKIITPILAMGTVLLTFILFYMVMFKPMGAEKDIIIYILGALTAIDSQIFSYYFGSSKSSSAKTDQITKMLEK